MDFGLSLRETVDKYGLMAKKSLGQNFLLNQNITDKIVRSSLSKQGLEDFKGREILEIGPGPGGLTRAVLKQTPDKLTVVEMDTRCIEIMESLREVSGAKMDIINADALTFDFIPQNARPAQIISNLPYNISVPLLTRWLMKMPAYEALTLMFQKEVAERIMANQKTKNYGRLSVLSQLICRIDKLCDINPECFVPAPKIWSSVLLFRPLDEQPDSKVLEKVEKLTALAFAQRRKMIRQSLKTITNLEKICSDVGIELTCRAEEISPQQYYRLAQLL